MKSQVFDFKRVYIFVAKTTKSEIHEKSTSCEAIPPVNAYNVSGFELPFILVLLDADDIVVRNTIVQNSEHGNVLSAIDFVGSEGADEGLSYPMHLMVRDVNGNAAYGYLDDMDAQPEIQMVHVGEDEST